MTFDEVPLRYLIDSVFGTFEDTVSACYSPDSVLQATTAEVRDWGERIERAMIGKNMSWVPYADEWPNEDEPDDCVKVSPLVNKYIHFGTAGLGRARRGQWPRGRLKR